MLSVDPPRELIIIWSPTLILCWQLVETKPGEKPYFQLMWCKMKVECEMEAGEGLRRCEAGNFYDCTIAATYPKQQP
jgi:hypothetical protein